MSLDEHNKDPSGFVVFLNGAAIAWKTRPQTTVKLNSTEADVGLSWLLLAPGY